MSIDECRQKHTVFQMQVWNAWIDMREDCPSADQYYLMQIAQEVRRGWAAGHPKKIKLEDFKLRFVVPGQSSAPDDSSPEALAERTRILKGVMFARLQCWSNKGSRHGRT